MDLQSIYIANGIGIFVLLFLRYTSRTKLLQRRTEDKIFFCMVYGVMLACFAEAFSYTIDGKLFTGAKLLNYIANTYLYSVNILLPFCVLVYVDLGLFGDLKRIPKLYKPQIIVGIVMLAANILNLFVPIAYRITADNMYRRLPFSYVYYGVILYYCITAIVLVRRYEKENGAKVFFSIDMFLVPILVGAGLQFLLYGLSLAWLSAAVGLVGLFMMQQNELAYIDPLTDTYNRQYLNHILSAWVGRGNSFVGAMLDMDNFKQINDSFGHTEGDRALKTVADTLKRARLDRELVFRFAGDEFVVLKRASSEEELSAYMAEVDRLLAACNADGQPYRLAVSYGISRFESGSVDSFMRAMDDRMYQMKAGHHAEPAR